MKTIRSLQLPARMLWGGLLLLAGSLQAADDPVLIVPQAGCYSSNGTSTLAILDVSAQVTIHNTAAVTQLEFTVQNTSTTEVNGVLMVPVPEASQVQSLTCSSTTTPLSNQLHEQEKAWTELETLTKQYREPALVEFADTPLVTSERFSMPAEQNAKVRIAWETKLPSTAARVDYSLPRSERLDYQVPWSIQAEVKTEQPISAVYSHSHQIQVQAKSLTHSTVLLDEAERLKPGTFRLSTVTGSQPLTATVWTSPATNFEGGYFQLLLAADPSPPTGQETTGWNREVLFVLDRSSSMRGMRIKELTAGVQTILNRMQPGDTCNVITFANDVQTFAPAPVKWTKTLPEEIGQWMTAIEPRGGTNIHAALSEALSQPTQEGLFRVVYFVTDGLPTIGKFSEENILELIDTKNHHDRRIFSFGLGAEINSPLLGKIAVKSRGMANYSLEDNVIEQQLLKTFLELDLLVCTQVKLSVEDPSGLPALERVDEMSPRVIPDLYRHEPVVLLGRYHGNNPLQLTVSVDYRGENHRVTVPLDPTEAETGEDLFLHRLWAARKIASLVDGVRQEGSGAELFTYTYRQEPDPKVEQSLGEILDLTTRYGILTEYTEFLAHQSNRDLKNGRIPVEVVQNFSRRAIQTRSGVEGIQQDLNNGRLQNQMTLNSWNCWLNSELEPVSVTTVQQVGSRTLFRETTGWREGILLRDPSHSETPEKTIPFGTQEYFELLRLLAERGDHSLLSLRGEIVFLLEETVVRVKNPAWNPIETPPVFLEQQPGYLYQKVQPE